MPRNVTMLQVTCILVVLTFGSLLNSWYSLATTSKESNQAMYEQCRSGKQLLRQTYMHGRTRTVATSWSSASYWHLILFELVSCSSHKRRFACVLPSE